jgi:nicotinic acid mononucleotide adenylyltransferase
VDAVLCVVPSVLPHKRFFGATIEQRLELVAAARLNPSYGIATTERGLFIDIARECRAHYGVETRLRFVCGRDAAERVLGWDYGRAGAVAEMLSEFELLVAPRGGDFEPPPEFRDRIHPLRIRTDWADVSSTEVRERIERGLPWEYLVPETIVDRVRAIYS